MGAEQRQSDGRTPKTFRHIRQAGLLTAIPFVLLIGPLIGYYVGDLVDRRTRSEPWGAGVGISIGLIASARVTIQLIQQAQRMNDDAQ